MTTYWANFARTGDPNGRGLPAWPRYDQTAAASCTSTRRSRAAPDALRARYEALDAFAQKQRAAH